MSEARDGKVITFYSFKGGTGRTMALANVAWILASAGNRVLVADWDLEAPGLPRFFKPFLPEAVGTVRGVIDLVREYENVAARDLLAADKEIGTLATVGNDAIPVNWDFADGGSLDLLTAGLQNDQYASSLSGIDWDNFYDRLNGGNFLDALREDMRRNYDYTLIDSRTGFCDVAAICTQHLPDVLVDCFTLSDQGIDGAARVAAAVTTYGKKDGDGRHVRVLPVPMRVDSAEKVKADAGRACALQAFRGLPADMPDDERLDYFSRVEVPYQAFYAYEEILATFDRPGVPGSLLASYERLAGVLSDGAVQSLPRLDERVRTVWQHRFERPLRAEKTEIVLEYAAEDQVWAEWVETVLTPAGITVIDRGPVDTGPVAPADDAGRDILSIVSPSYVASGAHPASADPAEPARLVLKVGDARVTDVPTRATAHLVGLSEADACRQLLQLVGHAGTLAYDHGTRTARFPGVAPRWFKVPGRNAMFTGRKEDLVNLRTALKAQDRAVLLPVALHGMGGIGKTQLAVEYVHRYGGAYDLVWWITADRPQDVEATLADLGDTLELQPAPTRAAMARSVLDALRTGAVAARWLLVFDNAGEPGDDLKDLLPQGKGGHVLITSRDQDWSQHAHDLQVDVFRREESVAHLRSRAPALTPAEAGRIGGALGDLPIAVATAAAWLAETGTGAHEYLRQIEEREGRNPWEATWDLSLERLRRSAGAYRLLQICSVLGTDIALDLVYSDQMAAALSASDPLVSERVMRAALVQRINRLALLKLDPLAREINVHRLIQTSVRNRMTDDELRDARHDAHLVLARFRPSGEPDDPDSWPAFRMIWPHLEVSNAMTCHDESVRQLLVDRVRYLRRRGDLAEGLTLARQVEATWAARIGLATNAALQRQLLHLRFNMANILRDQADYDEALELDKQVLAEQRTLLGDRHSHTLMTSGSLAADLRALGNYGEALHQDELTFQIWREDFGDDHPRTLMAANNYAASLRASGDFRRAQTIDEDVARRRQAVLGATHPYTLHSLSCLGRDLREAGEYQPSVKLLREVVGLAQKHLGPESFDTFNVQANLAASLSAAGYEDEAAPLLQRTYDDLCTRFGERNPNTLACRLNRAANLYAQRRTSEAVTEMEGVTAAYTESIGPDNPFTLVSLSNLSAAYWAADRPEEARELATRAEQGCATRLGDRHPFYLAAAMNVLIFRYELGDDARSVDELKKLADDMSEVIGRSHPDTLCCTANLAILRNRLGMPGSGGRSTQDEVTEAIQALAAKLGPTHPWVQDLKDDKFVVRVISPHEPF